MRIGTDGHHYHWVEGWARLPDEERLHAGWAHNALAVTRGGQVVGFHPADGEVVVLERDGTVVRTFDCGLIEGHGMTLVEEDGEEFLWVADCGLKMVPKDESPQGYGIHVAKVEGTRTVTLPNGQEYQAPLFSGQVLKVRLSDGAVVVVLPKPDHELYGDKPYLPTAVTVAPDGTIWVGDGYGASLVHRFAPDGRVLLTLTGEESEAGRFDCPHGMVIDRRRSEPELYVADRESLRLLVFDLQGNFRREVAKGQLARPSALAIHGDLLAVAELRARVALLDLDDRVVGYLGDNEAVADTPGWPNSLVDGKVMRQLTLTPGKFNSPHGLAIDSGGNLYVTEWLVGGRFTKLEPEL